MAEISGSYNLVKPKNRGIPPPLPWVLSAFTRTDKMPTLMRWLKKWSAPLLSDSEYANRVLKVNHAGEHGAVNIYRGQIFAARFTVPSMLAELNEFKSHEERHRSIFWSELQRRGRSRCKSYLACGLGGFILGLVTGLFGSRAIAATTVAVERVVLNHLEQQLKTLRDTDSTAYAAVSAIVDEEKYHYDQSASHIQTGQFWPRALTPVVAGSTELVIWLGMRL